jgi:hypothetical protein
MSRSVMAVVKAAFVAAPAPRLNRRGRELGEERAALRISDGDAAARGETDHR